MNIFGGKDVLKFFSKNKKSVSEESEEKFPNAYTMQIRKEDKITHAEAICADGKLYSTKNAEIIFFEQEDSAELGYTFYFGRTYFVTAKGNWFSAHTAVSKFTKEYREENMIITSKQIAYSILRIENKDKIKVLLGNKDISLYKKYFGEVEEG